MSNKLYALIAIVDHSRGDELASVYNNENVPVSIATHGHGIADSSVLEMLGFGENKKSIFISIVTKAHAKQIFGAADEKMHIAKPGKGILFTVPLTSATAFLAGLVQNIDTQNFSTQEGENVMTKEHEYELIITIVTKGFSSNVKDAAISAGARGGTLIHALGLGGAEAQKFLGIKIAPEKDLVLNVVPCEMKKDVMTAISNSVGINTEGQGIIFSLPVDSALGLTAASSTQPE